MRVRLDHVVLGTLTLAVTGCIIGPAVAQVASDGPTGTVARPTPTTAVTHYVPGPTVTVTEVATKTITETKTKTLMRVVKRTVANRSVVTKRPPVGYVLTADGRIVKVWAECFTLRGSEVRPGNYWPDDLWHYCDVDNSDEWKDQPR
jgi:hypothetical protein